MQFDSGGLTAASGLYGKLVSPLMNDPKLTIRLASSSGKLATTWRKFPLTLEAQAAQAIVARGRRAELVWAGHLPDEIAREFDGQLQWRRIVLGGKDRFAELRRLRPYLPVSLLSAQLRSSLSHGVQVNKRVLAETLRSYVRIFRRLSPEVLVITASYDPAIRLVGLAARAAGVSVALYGHGLSSPGYWLSVDDNLSTHFLCWTAEEADEYVRLGVEPNRIFTVGPLRTISAHVEGANAPNIFLWLGSRLRSERYLRCLQDASRISAANGSHLLYRPHPLEDPSDVSSVVPASSMLDPRVPIEKQARSASVVISGASTALVEAGMAGAATLYLSDLFENTSPALDLHLIKAASWTTKCNGLSGEAIRLAQDRVTKYHYLNPRVEILRLIRRKAFSVGLRD